MNRKDTTWCRLASESTKPWTAEQREPSSNRGERRVGDPTDLIQLTPLPTQPISFIASFCVRLTPSLLGAQGTSRLSIQSDSSIYFYGQDQLPTVIVPLFFFLDFRIFSSSNFCSFSPLHRSSSSQLCSLSRIPASLLLHPIRSSQRST